MGQNRRLAAIMFTDMVGFSRLTQEDPLLARELNEEHQKIVRLYLKNYEGLEKQTTGDGFFAEFKSAVEAMNCSVEIQQALHDRNLTRSSENKIFIRIGLHLGDIFEKDNEIFGDSVNIAARLEPLADPEGICVSKAFFDLVKSNWSDHKFSSMGLFQLKNIQGSVELFKFNFPWHAKNKNQVKDFLILVKSLFNQEQWSLISLFSIGLFFLLFIFFKVMSPQLQSLSSSDRAPSSAQIGVSEAKLDKAWSYSFDEKSWQDFNAKESWRYADILKGQYALRNEFVITAKPLEPSIVIGLIPDSHRAYLNGHYIGGSNHLSDLALYTFDPSYLNIFPDKNTLVVKAEARPSLNPGIIALTDVTPQMAEFSKLNSLRSGYYLKFYILKNIYFVFSFIAFILSLTYAIYLKNKNEIFYSSLFLLLGCLHYLYYNPWVISSFDYQFLRFLRLSCIVVSSLVLYSGYLASRGRKVFCSWNNALALVFGILTFSIFNFYAFENSEKFVSFYNTALLLGLVYVSIAVLSAFGTEVMQRKFLNKKSSPLEPYFFLFFTFLSLSNILGAFKNGRSEVFFSAQARTHFNDFGIAVAFLFAIARITLAVFEFTKQKRQNLQNKKKDNFFIELTKAVSDGQGAFLKIDKIHKLANQFLQSEKSSLYLASAENQNELKLHSNKGYSAEIENTKSSLEGVFGYVIQHKRPLLIEDINQDYRFEIKLNEQKQFKSGSCMIFPLIVEDKIFGVLTFADKESKTKFSSMDLEIGLKVSSFVSLLIVSSSDFKKAS